MPSCTPARYNRLGHTWYLIPTNPLKPDYDPAHVVDRTHAEFYPSKGRAWKPAVAQEYRHG